MYLKLNEKSKAALKEKRISFINEDISTSSMTRVCEEILEFVNENDTLPISIAINCGGGSLASSLIFNNFLKTLPADLKINAVVTGYCASAAVVILQSCKRRLALPNSLFLIHNSTFNISVTDDGTGLDKAKIAIKTSQKIRENAIRIELQRTGLTRKEWDLLAHDGDVASGSTLTTETALELNLIDEIIDSFEMF